MNSSYDYIIVGAGSAGCVLANRLSADASARVLLLEAGGENKSFYIDMPSGYGKVIGKSQFDWCFSSGPEPYIGNRELFTPRGKGLGGSSAINGLAYVRGHQADFDHWRGLNLRGWAWEDVLPVFKRIENFQGPPSPVRSRDGVMHVTSASAHPLSLRLIEAAHQAGLKQSSDYNDGDPSGLALVQSNTWRGRRFSSYRAYLEPARTRANLEIRTQAVADRIRLEGSRATGVEYRHSGQNLFATATGELIIAAGSIGTPKLLELSGIGSPPILQERGIAPRIPLEGVGENLQDHYNVGIQLKLKNIRSLNEEMRGVRLMLHGAHYLFTRGGTLAGSPAQVTGYARVMEDSPSADIQLWGMPGSVVVKKGSRNENRLMMDDEPGVALSFYPNRPRSRGYVHIRSKEPDDAPLIVNNYMHHAHDCEVIVRGLRLCRRILEQPTFDPYRVGSAGPDAAFESDEAIIAYARSAGRSAYHLVGTCRMGVGKDAVVDEKLRVRGIQKLRIIDSSVMPVIVSGNTHAATVMIAEKGADFVLAARKGLDA